MAIEVIKVTEEDITVTLTDVGVRGRPGLVFRGEWDNATQYYQGDAVTFDGNTYIATGSPALGDDPTNAGWELLVRGSPEQANLVDFHTQSATGNVPYDEGDLLKGLDSEYYWALTAGTLESTTVLSDNSTLFEPRGYQPTLVTSGELVDRPVSGTNIGDIFLTLLNGIFIWDGAVWLPINPQTVTIGRNGLMLATDKAKLDGIEALSEANDKVEVDFSVNTITVTSTADGITGQISTADIPDATDATKGIVTIDTTSLSVANGIISADNTIDLDQLDDITAATTTESGYLLSSNGATDPIYSWAKPGVDAVSIKRWDSTGDTNYFATDSTNSDSIGSDIVEFEGRIYITTRGINYGDEGSCNQGTFANRSLCEDTGAEWIILTPKENIATNNPSWNIIGPGTVEELDDVNLSIAESNWSANDSPILARVGDTWRLFPGLDSLANIGDIPVPTTLQAGYVLTTDGAADPTYTWDNRIARVQDYDILASYVSGDLVRSEDTIFLAIRSIVADGGLPSDGLDWQIVGPSTVESLQDTVIDSTTITNGDVLTYEGGVWKNLSAGDALADAISLVNLGDVPENTVADKVLVSTGIANTEGDRYTWEDYGRDIKSIQAYNAATLYVGGDLVHYVNSIYISRNSAIPATSSAPTGVNLDPSWDQLGASTLTHINDVPEPSAAGQVLAYTGEDNSGVDTFGWTTEIETAARVPAFATNEAYAEGALVTVGSGLSLSVFIAIKAIAASNVIPTDDGVNWEIIGPERMTNLEDTSINSTVADSSLLQYDSTGDVWEDKTIAQVAGDIILANIGDVTTPISGTNDNQVLQAVFPSDTNLPVQYGWIDRTTNTTTIQGFSATKEYTAGELVYLDHSIYLALLSSNTNRTPGIVGSETFWQLIGPETFEDLEDSVIDTPLQDQIINYDATKAAWINTDLITETKKLVDVSDLKDVSGTAGTANQVLQRNAAGDSWDPVTPATLAATMNSGEIGDIDLLTEVVVENDLLQRVGDADTGTWIPKSVTELAAQITVENLGNVADTVASGSFLQKIDTTTGGVTTTAYEGQSATDVADQITVENLGNVADTVASGSFLQKIDTTTGGVTTTAYEGQSATDIADQITVENLGNVADTVATGSFLQKIETTTGGVTTTTYEGQSATDVSGQIDAGDLKDITLGATTLLDGDVLQRSGDAATGTWINTTTTAIAGQINSGELGDITLADTIPAGDILQSNVRRMG